jgi:hypothetical protein
MLRAEMGGDQAGPQQGQDSGAVRRLELHHSGGGRIKSWQTSGRGEDKRARDPSIYIAVIEGRMVSLHVSPKCSCVQNGEEAE